MSIKKNDPMRLDVSYMVKGSPGTYKEFEFNFPQLALPDDLLLVDIQGLITVSVTEDGVVAEGKINALTELIMQPLSGSLLAAREHWIHRDFFLPSG